MQLSIPCGLVARISGFHPGGPGSIPGKGVRCFNLRLNISFFGDFVTYLRRITMHGKTSTKCVPETLQVPVFRIVTYYFSSR